MRFLPLLPLLLSTLAAGAQTPGSCERGAAEGDLVVNDVLARVFNTGSLFFGNSTVNGDGYLVPRVSGHSPIFAAGIWIGGKVNGQIRVAGSRYTWFEFWPGPLEHGASLPNPADCSAFDRIYVISRDDVEHFLLTGEATDDLLDWPVELGAPVLDGDGNPDNYDLSAGDQPAIYGEQTAWWVMNDVGNAHEETESNPLGVEVQVTAMAGRGGSVQFEQTTFYRYRIINRSSHSMDEMYVSFFSDPDLGDATDDYIGSDTTLSMGFVYNGNEVDAVYGIPPAQGIQVAQGPVGLPNDRDDDGDGTVDEPGERLGMTAFTYFVSGGPAPLTDPRAKEEYYNHMQGRWNDGVPLTEFGNGYQTDGPATKFAWPGDPVEEAFWTEENTDGSGSSNPVGDRRMVVHTGPFKLAPDEAEEIVFAMPFGQGVSRLDSVTKLRVAAQVAQNAWDFGFLEPTRVEVEPLPPEAPGAIEIQRPFPNPFTDRATLRYTVPDGLPVRITLLDVLGRELSTLASGEHAAGTYEAVVEGSSLVPGVYLVRVEVVGESRVFSVIKTR